MPAGLVNAAGGVSVALAADRVACARLLAGSSLLSVIGLALLLASAHGRIFTARGVAGIAAPWLASVLFGIASDFRAAFALALAVVGLGLALNLTLAPDAGRSNSGGSHG